VRLCTSAERYDESCKLFAKTTVSAWKSCLYKMAGSLVGILYGTIPRLHVSVADLHIALPKIVLGHGR
jgi:hypothetical protein